MGTVGDLTRSLILLLIPVLLVAAFWASRRDEPQRVRVVDYEQTLTAAREAANFQVLAPEGLSDEWRATNVSFEQDDDDEAHWHLGFLGPDDVYVSVDQSDGDSDDLLEDVLTATVEDGSSSVSGETWQRLVEVDMRSPDRALVRTVGGVTTVVLGTGSYAQLEDLAEKLR